MKLVCKIVGRNNWLFKKRWRSSASPVKNKKNVLFLKLLNSIIKVNKKKKRKETDPGKHLKKK